MSKMQLPILFLAVLVLVSNLHSAHASASDDGTSASDDRTSASDDGTLAVVKTTGCIPAIAKVHPNVICRRAFGNGFQFVRKKRECGSLAKANFVCRKSKATPTVPAPVPAPTPASTLTSELENHNIVMVTQGTCASKGYQPIDDALDCMYAASNLDLDFAMPEIMPKDGSCSIAEVGRGGQARAVYGGGHSSCSHRQPCICSGPTSDNPVCETGEFRPDPNKYYTIRSPNGRYLASLWKQYSGFSSIVRTPNEVDNLSPWTSGLISRILDHKTLNKVHKRAQWRFIETDTGSWIIRNRATGGEVYAYSQLFSRSEIGSSFSATCDKDQVFFETARTEGEFPRDCCEDYAPRNEIPVVYNVPNTVFYEHRQSNCVKKSRSCRSLYGSGYEQTSRSLCGVFNQLHELSCRKTISPPTSMKVKQRWFVEELDEFFRAGDIPDAPVVFETLSSPAAAADAMATGAEGAVSIAIAAGAVALQGLGVPPPIGVAALSFGVGVADDLFDFIPNEPDLLEELADQINQAMQKLVADMERRTDSIVFSEIASNDAKKIKNSMLARRDWFLTIYPALKHDEIENYQDSLGNNSSEQDQLLKLENIDDLADIQLFTKVDEFDNDIKTFFGFDTSPTELNAKRSDLSFDILKIAIVENLLMKREGYLLKAYARPDERCDTVMPLVVLSKSVNDFRQMLLGARDTLVEYYLNHEKCASASCQKEQPYVQEFLWDVENFSYPVHEQMAFLDTYVSDTIAMCEKLRTDEQWKKLFETEF